MKRFITLLMVVAALVVLAAPALAANEDSQQQFVLKSIKFETTKLTIDYAATPVPLQLLINDELYDPTKHPLELLWSSSNLFVAAIDGDRAVDGIAKGKAKITVLDLTTKKKATCTVTVTGPAAFVIRSMKLSPSKKTLFVGDKAEVAVVYKTKNDAQAPQGAGQVIWSSSKPKIATVDSANGLITAVAKGSAKITATNIMTGRKASLTLTVKAPKVAAPAAVSSFKYEMEHDKFISIESLLAYMDIADGKALADTMEWASSNSAIVLYTDKGVRAAAEGTATLTGKSGSRTIVITITVKSPAPKTIAFTMDEGEFQPLTTIVELLNVAEFSDVVNAMQWTTSNKNVAYVTDLGVRAEKAGTCQLIGTYNSRKLIMKVTVVAPARNYTMKEGDYASLSSVLSMLDLAYTQDEIMAMGWTSSNNSIVYYTDAGLRAEAIGKAMITGSGARPVTFNVTVTK